MQSSPQNTFIQSCAVLEPARTHSPPTNNKFITCYKMDNAMSTPINTITRENLTVLIANNILNNSLEFISDCATDTMETDSPIRKPSGQPISKKLFHSPMPDSPNEAAFTWTRSRKAKKRKQNILVPDNSERIKTAYVKECEQDGYSPDVYGGMRKRVLISLFHNKEYCMDFDS